MGLDRRRRTRHDRPVRHRPDVRRALCGRRARHRGERQRVVAAQRADHAPVPAARRPRLRRGVRRRRAVRGARWSRSRQPPRAWYDTVAFPPDLRFRRTMLGDQNQAAADQRRRRALHRRAVLYRATCARACCTAWVAATSGCSSGWTGSASRRRRPAAILFADLEASGALSRRLSSRGYFELIRDADRPDRLVGHRPRRDRRQARRRRRLGAVPGRRLRRLGVRRRARGDRGGPRDPRGRRRAWPRRRHGQAEHRRALGRHADGRPGRHRRPPGGHRAGRPDERGRAHRGRRERTARSSPPRTSSNDSTPTTRRRPASTRTRSPTPRSANSTAPATRRSATPERSPSPRSDRPRRRARHALPFVVRARRSPTVSTRVGPSTRERMRPGMQRASGPR